jgi:hypothetical protein
MKSHQKKMSKKQNAKKYNSRRNIKKFKQHGGWSVNCTERIIGQQQPVQIQTVQFQIDVNPDDYLYEVYKKIHSNLITRHPHISLYQMHVRLNDQHISWIDLEKRHRPPDPPGRLFLRLRNRNEYHTYRMRQFNFQQSDYFTVWLLPNTTAASADFKTIDGQSYKVTFNRYDPIYIVKEKLLQQNPALAAQAPTYAHIYFQNAHNDLGYNLEPIPGYYIDRNNFHLRILNTPVVDPDVTYAYEMAAALAAAPVAPAAPPPAMPSGVPAQPPVAGGRYKWNY